MSDYKPNIYINFINRQKGEVITTIPAINRVTINKDIRQLTDSFDFDITFRLDSQIDINSHDFVEFYISLNNTRLSNDKNALGVSDGDKFQICCGFIEDFVKEISGNIFRFQANGRDFLGQLFNLPFFDAQPLKSASLYDFLSYSIKNTYMEKYLEHKGIKRIVIESGAYQNPLLVPQLSDAMRAPVLQQTADEVYNIIYQNRFGQAIIWGSDGGLALQIPYTLNEKNDFNVNKFTVRENFSRVVSEVKVFWMTGENNIGYSLTPSLPFKNTESRALQVYQPLIRTYQFSSLVTKEAAISAQTDKNNLAKSILRKSNQNLLQVIISTSLPYYIAPDGTHIGYEVNQIWNIKSESFKINDKMRLVGINYSQTDSDFEVQLLFILKDSLA